MLFYEILRTQASTVGQKADGKKQRIILKGNLNGFVSKRKEDLIRFDFDFLY